MVCLASYDTNGGMQSTPLLFSFSCTRCIAMVLTRRVACTQHTSLLSDDVLLAVTGVGTPSSSAEARSVSSHACYFALCSGVLVYQHKLEQKLEREREDNGTRDRDASAALPASAVRPH